MSGQPIEISVSDGALIRGLSWPGRSPVLLLLHEPGEERDLDDWRPLLPYLLDEGATVVAIDLRGHGASDSEWDEAVATDDLAAVVAWVREQATPVVVCAAGISAVAALRAAERGGIDGLVLLSPQVAGDPSLRGAGVPKLLFAGAQSAGALAEINHLRTISIGQALSVALPVAEQGTALLSGAAAGHVREHLLRFLREQRLAFNGAVGRIGVLPNSFSNGLVSSRRESAHDQGNRHRLPPRRFHP